MPVVHEHHLKNGMTILCFAQPQLHSVAFGLYLKGGSLYENRQNQGISHLLEHLCFRSLGGLSHEELKILQCRQGFELDGATYPEAIVFQSECVSRLFDEHISLYRRFFMDIPWTEQQISEEKQVVLRQIEQEEPDFDDEIERRYRKTTNGAFPLMGTAESVAGISMQTIRRWQRLIFQPQNACLCVSGNFTEEQEKGIDSLFEAFENVTEEAPFTQVQPIGFCMRDAQSDFCRDEENQGLAQVHIGFDINTDEVMPLCAHVLNTYTGGNCDSILFETLREQEALIGEIDSSIEGLGEFIRMIIRYDVRQEKLIESMEKVFRLLAKLKIYVRPVRLELSRMEFTENHDMMLDSASGMNELLGWGWVASDVARADMDEQAAMYDNLAEDDLLNAAQTIFRPENMTISVSFDSRQVSERQVKKAMAEARSMLG